MKEEVVAVENTSSATLSDLLDALYNRDYEQLPPSTEIDPTTTFSDLINTLMDGNLSPPPPYEVNNTETANNNNNKQDDNPFESAFGEAIQQQQAAFDEAIQQQQQQTAFGEDIQQQAAFSEGIQQPAAAQMQPNNILYRFDDMLMQWMNEVIRMEGTFKNNATIKDEVAGVLDRMLQDGLISMYEHGQMIYTNQLFVRLHDLIHMNMHALNRREIMDILVKLFEMGKITNTVLVEMCINI